MCVTLKDDTTIGAQDTGFKFTTDSKNLLKEYPTLIDLVYSDRLKLGQSL